MNNIHYSHLLPAKQGVIVTDKPRVIRCDGCKCEVETTSRVRRYCDTCAVDRQHRREAKAQAKAKRKRERDSGARP